MNEIFNSELKRVEEISKYNKQRASRLLDDMASAFIGAHSDSELDKSLCTVRATRASLRRNGWSVDRIDDYLMQRSTCQTVRVQDFNTDSIYENDSVAVRANIVNRPAHHTDKTTTDLIIEVIQSRPLLHSALQRKVSRQYLSKEYGVTQPTMLIAFYDKYSELINE